MKLLPSFLPFKSQVYFRDQQGLECEMEHLPRSLGAIDSWIVEPAIVASSVTFKASAAHFQ
jgi:hypothetical protein